MNETGSFSSKEMLKNKGDEKLITPIHDSEQDRHLGNLKEKLDRYQKNPYKRHRYPAFNQNVQIELVELFENQHVLKGQKNSNFQLNFKIRKLANYVNKQAIKEERASCFIHKIVLIGGKVHSLFTKEYLKDILFSHLKVKDVDRILTPEIVKNYQGNPSDIDIRFYVPHANTRDLQTISGWIEDFFSKKLQKHGWQGNTKQIIHENAFTKLFIPPGIENQYLTVGISDRDLQKKVNDRGFLDRVSSLTRLPLFSAQTKYLKTKRDIENKNFEMKIQKVIPSTKSQEEGASQKETAFDLLFVRHLKRPHGLFKSDSIHIDLTPVWNLVNDKRIVNQQGNPDPVGAIRNGYLNLVVFPESIYEYDGCVQRLIGAVEADEAEEMDSSSWSALASRYTKGHRSVQTDLEDLSFKNLLKSQVKRGGVLEAAIYYLNNAIKNHHSFPTSAAALTFNGCLLAHQQDKKLNVVSIWLRLRDHFYQSNHSLVKMMDLAFLVGVSFESFHAYLQVAALLYMMAPTVSSPRKARLLLHNDKPSIQIFLGEKIYLLLPFEPAKAFQTILSSPDTSLFSEILQFFQPECAYAHDQRSSISHNFEALNLDLKLLHSNIEALLTSEKIELRKLGCELALACHAYENNPNIFHVLTPHIPMMSEDFHFMNRCSQLMKDPLHALLIEKAKNIRSSWEQWCLILASSGDLNLLHIASKLWTKAANKSNYTVEFIYAVAHSDLKMAINMLKKSRKDGVTLRDIVEQFIEVTAICQKKKGFLDEHDRDLLIREAGNILCVFKKDLYPAPIELLKTFEGLLEASKKVEDVSEILSLTNQIKFEQEAQPIISSFYLRNIKRILDDPQGGIEPTIKFLKKFREKKLEVEEADQPLFQEMLLEFSLKKGKFVSGLDKSYLSNKSLKLANHLLHQECIQKFKASNEAGDKEAIYDALLQLLRFNPRFDDSDELWQDVKKFILSLGQNIQDLKKFYQLLNNEEFLNCLKPNKIVYFQNLFLHLAFDQFPKEFEREIAKILEEWLSQLKGETCVQIPTAQFMMAVLKKGNVEKIPWWPKICEQRIPLLNTLFCADFEEEDLKICLPVLLQNRIEWLGPLIKENEELAFKLVTHILDNNPKNGELKALLKVIMQPPKEEPKKFFKYWLVFLKSLKTASNEVVFEVIKNFSAFLKTLPEEPGEQCQDSEEYYKAFFSVFSVASRAIKSDKKWEDKVLLMIKAFEEISKSLSSVQQIEIYQQLFKILGTRDNKFTLKESCSLLRKVLSNVGSCSDIDQEVVTFVSRLIKNPFKSKNDLFLQEVNSLFDLIETKCDLSKIALSLIESLEKHPSQQLLKRACLLLEKTSDVSIDLVEHEELIEKLIKKACSKSFDETFPVLNRWLSNPETLKSLKTETICAFFQYLVTKKVEHVEQKNYPIEESKELLNIIIDHLHSIFSNDEVKNKALTIFFNIIYKILESKKSLDEKFLEEYFDKLGRKLAVCLLLADNYQEISEKSSIEKNKCFEKLSTVINKFNNLSPLFFAFRQNPTEQIEQEKDFTLPSNAVEIIYDVFLVIQLWREVLLKKYWLEGDTFFEKKSFLDYFRGTLNHLITFKEESPNYLDLFDLYVRTTFKPEEKVLFEEHKDWIFKYTEKLKHDLSEQQIKIYRSIVGHSEILNEEEKEEFISVYKEIVENVLAKDKITEAIAMVIDRGNLVLQTSPETFSELVQKIIQAIKKRKAPIQEEAHLVECLVDTFIQNIASFQKCAQWDKVSNSICRVLFNVVVDPSLKYDEKNFAVVHFPLAQKILRNFIPKHCDDKTYKLYADLLKKLIPIAMQMIKKQASREKKLNTSLTHALYRLIVRGGDSDSISRRNIQVNHLKLLNKGIFDIPGVESFINMHAIIEELRSSKKHDSVFQSYIQDRKDVLDRLREKFLTLDFLKLNSDNLEKFVNNIESFVNALLLVISRCHNLMIKFDASSQTFLDHIDHTAMTLINKNKLKPIERIQHYLVRAICQRQDEKNLDDRFFSTVKNLMVKWMNAILAKKQVNLREALYIFTRGSQISAYSNAALDFNVIFYNLIKRFLRENPNDQEFLNQMKEIVEWKGDEFAQVQEKVKIIVYEAMQESLKKENFDLLSTQMNDCLQRFLTPAQLVQMEIPLNYYEFKKAGQAVSSAEDFIKILNIKEEISCDNYFCLLYQNLLDQLLTINEVNDISSLIVAQELFASPYFLLFLKKNPQIGVALVQRFIKRMKLAGLYEQKINFITDLKKNTEKYGKIPTFEIDLNEIKQKILHFKSTPSSVVEVREFLKELPCEKDEETVMHLWKLLDDFIKGRCRWEGTEKEKALCLLTLLRSIKSCLITNSSYIVENFDLCFKFFNAKTLPEEGVSFLKEICRIAEELSGNRYADYESLLFFLLEKSNGFLKEVASCGIQGQSSKEEIRIGSKGRIFLFSCELHQIHCLIEKNNCESVDAALQIIEKQMVRPISVANIYKIYEALYRVLYFSNTLSEKKSHYLKRVAEISKNLRQKYQPDFIERIFKLFCDIAEDDMVEEVLHIIKGILDRPFPTTDMDALRKMSAFIKSYLKKEYAHLFPIISQCLVRLNTPGMDRKSLISLWNIFQNLENSVKDDKNDQDEQKRIKQFLYGLASIDVQLQEKSCDNQITRMMNLLSDFYKYHTTVFKDVFIAFFNKLDLIISNNHKIIESMRGEEKRWSKKFCEMPTLKILKKYNSSFANILQESETIGKHLYYKIRFLSTLLGSLTDFKDSNPNVVQKKVELNEMSRRILLLVKNQATFLLDDVTNLPKRSFISLLKKFVLQSFPKCSQELLEDHQKLCKELLEISKKKGILDEDSELKYIFHLLSDYEDPELKDLEQKEKEKIFIEVVKTLAESGCFFSLKKAVDLMLNTKRDFSILLPEPEFEKLFYSIVAALSELPTEMSYPLISEISEHIFSNDRNFFKFIKSEKEFENRKVSNYCSIFGVFLRGLTLLNDSLLKIPGKEFEINQINHVIYCCIKGKIDFLMRNLNPEQRDSVLSLIKDFMLFSPPSFCESLVEDQQELCRSWFYYNGPELTNLQQNEKEVVLIKMITTLAQAGTPISLKKAIDLMLNTKRDLAMSLPLSEFQNVCRSVVAALTNLPLRTCLPLITEISGHISSHDRGFFHSIKSEKEPGEKECEKEPENRKISNYCTIFQELLRGLALFNEPYSNKNGNEIDINQLNRTILTCVKREIDFLMKNGEYLQKDSFFSLVEAFILYFPPSCCPDLVDKHPKACKEIIETLKNNSLSKGALRLKYISNFLLDVKDDELVKLDSETKEEIFFTTIKGLVALDNQFSLEKAIDLLVEEKYASEFSRVAVESAFVFMYGSLSKKPLSRSYSLILHLFEKFALAKKKDSSPEISFENLYDILIPLFNSFVEKCMHNENYLDIFVGLLMFFKKLCKSNIFKGNYQMFLNLLEKIMILQVKVAKKLLGTGNEVNKLLNRKLVEKIGNRLEAEYCPDDMVNKKEELFQSWKLKIVQET